MNANFSSNSRQGHGPPPSFRARTSAAARMRTPLRVLTSQRSTRSPSANTRSTSPSTVEPSRIWNWSARAAVAARRRRARAGAARTESMVAGAIPASTAVAGPGPVAGPEPVAGRGPVAGHEQPPRPVPDPDRAQELADELPPERLPLLGRHAVHPHLPPRHAPLPTPHADAVEGAAERPVRGHG